MEITNPQSPIKSFRRKEGSFLFSFLGNILTLIINEPINKWKAKRDSSLSNER